MIVIAHSCEVRYRTVEKLVEESRNKTMPYRNSLHSLVDMLADFGVFEGRNVTIEVVNGTDIRLGINPPLQGVVAGEVIARSKQVIEHSWPIAEPIDSSSAPAPNSSASTIAGKCH